MTEIDINGFWFRVWTKADPREDPEWVHEGGPLHGEAWPGLKLRVNTLEEAIAQSQQLWNALENKQRLSGWSLTDKYGTEKHPGTRTDRKFEYRIVDPDEIQKYVASAHSLYDVEHVAIVIANPPVVERTPAGARVLAWIPEAAAMPLDLNQPVNVIELNEPRIMQDGPSGSHIMAWLLIEDEDVWQ